MNHIDAMKQALDVLQGCLEHPDADNAIAALREALTAAQSATCWKCGDTDQVFQAACNVPACGMREALAAPGNQLDDINVVDIVPPAQTCAANELSWIRQHFHKAPDNPQGIVINGMQGLEVREWLDRVDLLLAQKTLPPMLSYKQVASVIKSIGFSAHAQKYHTVAKSIEAVVRKQFGVEEKWMKVPKSQG